MSIHKLTWKKYPNFRWVSSRPSTAHFGIRLFSSPRWLSSTIIWFKLQTSIYLLYTSWFQKFQTGDYSVSLKAPHRNKHFKVHVDGNMYCIGQRKFHNLDQLVDHYQRAPIFTNKQGEKLYLVRPLPRSTAPPASQAWRIFRRRFFSVLYAYIVSRILRFDVYVIEKNRSSWFFWLEYVNVDRFNSSALLLNE